MTTAPRLAATVVATAMVAATYTLAADEQTAGGHQQRPCPPRGQVVIAEDTTMRVYRPRRSRGNPSDLPVEACILGSQTRMTLIATPSVSKSPRRTGPGYLERVAIAGDVVAYVTIRRTGVDTGDATLTIAEVSHRVILREAWAGGNVDAGFFSSSRISALDVAPDGSAAWILHSSRGRRSTGSEVLAAARTGPIETLDKGPGVEPESLYLSGRTAHWVDAGITRGAPLPAAR